MRVSVNADRCQGHVLCLGTAPGIFDFDDESGHAEAAATPLPPERREAARRAAATCPKQAITMLDGDRP